MFLKVCFFVLLSGVLAEDEELRSVNTCSKPSSDCLGRVLPRQKGRAVGAFEDNIENVPYVVSLQWNGYHFCIGTILNPNTILTSAHCVKNIKPEDLPLYSIRAGSSDHRSGGQSVRLSTIHRHPDYIPYPAKNDIAVLKLATPLTFNGTIQAALLPENPKLKEFSWVLSSGWGLANYEGPGTTRIQSVFVPIVANKNCVDLFGDSFDTKRQLCTSEEPRASCQGDSGSALILDQVALGIITYTVDCPNVPTPKAYTKVRFFVEWIEGYLL